MLLHRGLRYTEQSKCAKKKKRGRPSVKREERGRHREYRDKRERLLCGNCLITWPPASFLLCWPGAFRPGQKKQHSMLGTAFLKPLLNILTPFPCKKTAFILHVSQCSCDVMESNCFPHVWHLTDGFSAGFWKHMQYFKLNSEHSSVSTFFLHSGDAALHAYYASTFMQADTHVSIVDVEHVNLCRIFNSLNACSVPTERKRAIEKGSISLTDQRGSTGQLDMELRNRKCLPANGTLG